MRESCPVDVLVRQRQEGQVRIGLFGTCTDLYKHRYIPYRSQKHIHTHFFRQVKYTHTDTINRVMVQVLKVGDCLAPIQTSSNTDTSHIEVKNTHFPFRLSQVHTHIHTHVHTGTQVAYPHRYAQVVVASSFRHLRWKSVAITATKPLNTPPHHQTHPHFTKQ